MRKYSSGRKLVGSEAGACGGLGLRAREEGLGDTRFVDLYLNVTTGL